MLDRSLIMLRGLMLTLMFVLIAHHTDRRDDVDRVATALDELSIRFGERFTLAPERTTGDELQALTGDAACALDAALHLLRSRHWRVGLGVGAVRQPLPASVREVSGSGITCARLAADRAITRSPRFAAVGADTAADAVHDWGALVDLLVTQRARWSPQGWQLHDLLETGLTQADAAERLGITPQAASKRARAAALRIDADARRALTRRLQQLTVPG